MTPRELALRETLAHQLVDIANLLREVHFCKDRDLLVSVLRVARHALSSAQREVDEWCCAGKIFLPLDGQNDGYSSERTAFKVALALVNQDSFDGEACIAELKEKFLEIREIRKRNNMKFTGERVSATVQP